MLNLRILQSPLDPATRESILSQYNRLTSSRIPMREFVHWVQEGPEGPACHAILFTDEGEVVGHTSLIPLRAKYQGRKIIAAKSEYSFIREECRALKVRGFEDSAQLRNMMLIGELFRHCRALGWGPLFISTTAAVHRLYRSLKCYPITIPVCECLLILRPWKAAQETPNIESWQRAALCAAGTLQGAVWSPLSAAVGVNGIRSANIDDGLPTCDDASLAFFEHEDTLRWRYLEGQYERFTVNSNTGDYVIVKRGGPDRYLRVLQWRLRAGQPNFATVVKLARMAREDKALGVRWAVYGNGDSASELVGGMRRAGFLCKERVRTLLVNTAEEKLLAAENWKLTDAMFSFDP